MGLYTVHKPPCPRLPRPLLLGPTIKMSQIRKLPHVRYDELSLLQRVHVNRRNDISRCPGNIQGPGRYVWSQAFIWPTNRCVIYLCR